MLICPGCDMELTEDQNSTWNPEDGEWHVACYADHFNMDLASYYDECTDGIGES